CSQTSMAQNHIGQTEEFIMRSNSTTFGELVKFDTKENLGNGDALLVFKLLGLKDSRTVYFMNNGVCKTYATLYPKRFLTMVVKANDEEYIRQSNNTWVNKDLTLRLTLNLTNTDEVAVKYENISNLKY